MMNSVVLLSGGLDSSVNLAKAVQETDVKLCLNINYGQRAAQKEALAAEKLVAHYNLKLEKIKLDFLARITKTSLVNQAEEVPEPEEKFLDSEIAFQTAAKVWVPNRNGTFINVAAAYAETLDCQLIITGFNKEEAQTFPDNSIEFLDAINKSLTYSTQNQPKVISYTQDLDKKEIVQLGKSLNLPFDYIWSCYHGGEVMCGKCESCRRYLRALKQYQV